VAVKVFRLDLTPEQAGALADELRRAVDAGLVHPSIVEPVAAGVEGTVAYRAEEYVAAESLDVAMRHYAPAALDKALPFIAQLAAAIDAARAGGVGHGALHPRDIFVTPDEARATGFGVVDALDRLGLRAPVRRPYSAPERIAGEQWSTPADVFSLGAIAFELLTGRRPAGIGDQMGSLAGAAGGAHLDDIHAVLAQAMHERPEERFATAGAFVSALERAAGETAADGVAAASVPIATPIAAQEIGPSTGTDAETPHALDDFAAEGPVLAPGDSPREVARKAIAARKRQHKPKPPAEPAPVDEPQPAAELFDAPVIEERPEPIVAGEVADDAVRMEVVPDAFPAPAPEEEIAEPPLIAAPTEAIADPLELPLDREPVLEPADVARHEMALHDSPEEAARDLEAIAPVVDEEEHQPSAVDEPSLIETIAARDLHDRIVPVDQFRSREASTREHQPKPDRMWPRSTERPTPLIVPQVRSSPDLLDTSSVFVQPEVPPDEPLVERSRIVMLPVAMGVILGLVVGYIAGYVVGNREQEQGRLAQQVQTPGSGLATPGTSGRGPGATYSEGAVASPPPASGPASSAPTGGKPATPSVAETPPRTPPPAPKPAVSAPAARATAKVSSGTIVVNSSPAKAGVVVNGKWMGRTPLTIERPFGKYAIRVVESGYAAATESVTLSASTPSRTIDATLRRTPAPPQATAKPKADAAVLGEIFIDSRPQGARVLIDGKPAGVTPLRLSNQAPGPREIRLDLADHQTWTAITRVTAGQTARVTGSLERIR
jgi:hypothetical protein